jgi:hypothetical protein
VSVVADDYQPDLYDALADEIGSRIIAAVAWCALERGQLNATPQQFFDWAATNLNNDDLWDKIGPVVDIIEARAKAALG